MCGFVGTTNKPLTEIMLKKQEHRGPDALSFWADKTFGFGHALLDITGANQTQSFGSCFISSIRRRSKDSRGIF